MLNQPKIEMVLYDGPMPTPRERQSSWLQYNFALLADIPLDHVSVVYADDYETITVHLACNNDCRCIMTLTMWIGSDDDHYTFTSTNGQVIELPAEPHAWGGIT
jgi:hypothetical protein